MATPSTVANKPSSSDTASLGWPRSAEPGSAFGGPGRPARGRPSRIRSGGRNNRNARGDNSTSSNGAPTSLTSDKSDRPALPAKPTLTITSPSNPPNHSAKPKNSSRRPSRANSTTTSQSSPVVETPVSPASSRSSNRRRRSGAGKGNNVPKINPPAPQDNLLRPGRPRIGAVPNTAPIKDPPPHLSHKSSHTPTGSFDMSKDIDALVERVRAVAMAENRPSTPGSHIDWAGDDDDSLPDLDDWGIPSLSAQAISPIIVGGLKPLPELSAASSANTTSKSETHAPTINDQEAESVPHVTSPPDAHANDLSSTEPANDKTQPSQIHPSLPPKPEVTSSIRVANTNHRQRPPRRPRPSGELNVASAATTASQPVSEGITDQRDSPPHQDGKDKSSSSGDASQNPEDSSDQDFASSGGLAQSIHAPSAEHRAESEKEGLAASIHAPRPNFDTTPALTHLGGRSPRNRQSYPRAQTAGRSFPRPHPNDTNFIRSPRTGRGGFTGSPRQHARNHSSPATSTTNRGSHSRPILTGDAISRLAKAVGNTATPPPKPTPVAND